MSSMDTQTRVRRALRWLSGVGGRFWTARQDRTNQERTKMDPETIKIFQAMVDVKAAKATPPPQEEEKKVDRSAEVEMTRRQFLAALGGGKQDEDRLTVDR